MSDRAHADVELWGRCVHDAAAAGKSGTWATAHADRLYRQHGGRNVTLVEAAGPKKKIPNKPGKSNWVEAGGGLPSYIRRIAEHLHGEGHSVSSAIAIAVGQVKKWAAGGGGVKPDTRAKAAAALAQWEKVKAKAKGKSALREASRLGGILMTADERTGMAAAFAARLTLVEGLLIGVDSDAPRAPAVVAARDLLEGREARLTVGGGLADPRAAADAVARLRSEARELGELAEALDPDLMEAAQRGKSAGFPKNDKPAEEPERQPLPIDSDPARITQLQNRLTSLGHGLKGDGHHGPVTDAAVRDFQRARGLADDGIVGPITTKALVAGQPGESVTPEADEQDQEQTGRRGTSEVMFKGMGVGERTGHGGVRQLQTDLGGMGYEIDADGRFGPQTEGAVKRMQRRYGLKPDGIVATKTQRTLRAVARKQKAKDRQAELEDDAPMDMEEANLRGSAKKSLMELKRLPDGQFAPKGSGMVLHPGQKVNVPHKSGDGTFVKGVALTNGGVKLHEGPDAGTKIDVQVPGAKASPGTGESTPKLKNAWAAFDKKMADFTQAKADPAADKKDLSKMAAQVRAAKWAIKRAGGDPGEKPGDLTPEQHTGPSAAGGDNKEWPSAPATKGSPEPDEANFKSSDDLAFLSSGEDAKLAAAKAKSDAKAAKSAPKSPAAPKAGPLTDDESAMITKADPATLKAIVNVKGEDEPNFGGKPGPYAPKNVQQALDEFAPEGAKIEKASEHGEYTINHKGREFYASIQPNGDTEIEDVMTGESLTGGVTSVEDAMTAMDNYKSDARAKGDPEFDKPDDDPAPAAPAPKKQTVGGAMNDAIASDAKKDAAPKLSPANQAALDAYKAAGGDDPAVLAALGDTPAPAAKPAPAPAAPVVPKSQPAAKDTQRAAEKNAAMDAALEDTLPDGASSEAVGDGEYILKHKGQEYYLSAINPDDVEIENTSSGSSITGGVTSLSDAMLAMDTHASKKAGPSAAPMSMGVTGLVNKPKPKVESYNPKTGPSAEQKAANAAVMKGGPAPAGGGMSDNTTGTSLDSMKQGDTFATADGKQYAYHKPTSGGAFHVVKPLDGGKATTFHGKMQPPKVGSGGGAPKSAAPAAKPSAAPAAPKASGGDDLFGQLKASVAANKAKTGKPVQAPPADKKGKDYDLYFGDNPLGAPKKDAPAKSSGGKTPSTLHPDIAAVSPGRGPTGKVRNFKAMSYPKLWQVVADLKLFKQDPEALAAAQDALSGKS